MADADAPDNAPPRASVPQRLIPIAFGLVSALALAWLLHRLLFEARAMSFDAMLYSRSLWGLANLDFHNTVIGQHSFAIHGHFAMALLAPLALLLPSALVMILAQASALGATAWLSATAFSKAAPSGVPKAAAGVWGGLLVLLGTPLVLNPFLFDVRPGLWAVPLVTAGLIRAVERGGFDKIAFAWMLPALFIREEFAIVVACALILSPEARQGAATLWDRKTRWIAAGASGAWFALYWFGIRLWLGGSEASTQAHLTGLADKTDGLPIADLLLYKALLLAVVFASVGGLALAGWRWAGACVPGLLLLLVSQWMPEHQLRFHYGMFVAPGLIAAAVAGLEHIRASDKPRLWVGATALIALAAFLVASAAPGGRLFADGHFDLTGEDSNNALIHTMIGKLPPDQGLAIPFYWGAPGADRSTITTTHRLKKLMEAKGKAPQTIHTVALPRKHWAGVGRFLVQQQGFVLIDRAGPLALISRAEGAQADIRSLALFAAPTECKKPVTTWPKAGLTLCGLSTTRDGRVSVTLHRHDDTQARPGLRLLLRPHDKRWEQAAPMWLMDGLYKPESLPKGALVTALTEGAMPASHGELLLVDGKGEPVANSSQATLPPMSVKWGADKP